MIPFFIFVFGLIFGSFLNAVIYRLQAKKNIIWLRSHCAKCQHVLQGEDLIPLLSFVFLKGKCRYCRQAISWQYPLVELATSIIFLVGYFYYLPSLSLTDNPLTALGAGQLLIANNYLTYLIFSCFLIVIFVYDLKYYLILDKITLPAFFIALALNALVLNQELGNLLLAALVLSGFFLFLFLISRGKWLGGGDLRLSLVMGAMLGWPNVLVAFALACFLGSIVGLIFWAHSLVKFRKIPWGTQLPFGTFLSLATVVTLLWGDEILKWYLDRLML